MRNEDASKELALAVAREWVIQHNFSFGKETHVRIDKYIGKRTAWRVIVEYIQPMTSEVVTLGHLEIAGPGNITERITLSVIDRVSQIHARVVLAHNESILKEEYLRKREQSRLVFEGIKSCPLCPSELAWAPFGSVAIPAHADMALQCHSKKRKAVVVFYVHIAGTKQAAKDFCTKHKVRQHEKWVIVRRGEGGMKLSLSILNNIINALGHGGGLPVFHG